ncbi:putative tRNA (cytidine(34)-2'-O)-methyltransferase [Camellia lanceoleosa]|uniref:tRNA (Cytidine(34)-2'-O)-methyltransferase n=1 Tax=Camellia lanceoleosa TaxID=1840588 RepID=A0ACC0I9X8_9ERIC|nr:putative tRNA (cytidine(34)-2'-O)-methyltransferase [Camellia lanceoleosa]
MESSSGLKTLNVIATTTPLHFRTRFSLFGQLHFPQLINKFNFSLSSPSSPVSPLCSLSERGNGVCLPNGVGEAIGEASPNKLLQVVLVSPQIPGNTGCIARTCAASAVGLHLVGPLGFQVDDAKLKRAGLDYWPYVVVKVHDSWAEFRNYFVKQDGEKRLLAFTKRGTTIHSDFSYRRGDWLVFGSETSGLPPEVVLDCKGEEAFGFGGGTIRIPMVETYVRCLNLSVSVGIALYEASRQLNYEQLLKSSPSQTCMDAAAAADNSFIAEDIFA